MTITYRAAGTPLTNAQIDANFGYLDYDLILNGDSNFSIPATAKVVATSAALTADRSWTLPSAASVAAGYSITVVDMAGGISDSWRLSVHVQSGENFNATLNNYIQLSIPFDRVIFTSNGVDNWSAGVHVNGQSQPDVAAALGLHELAWRDDSEVFLIGAGNAGNLVFSGNGRRIQGAFSGTTQSDRTMLQNSLVNQNTVVGILPNGTSTTAQVRFYGNSDPDAALAMLQVGMAGGTAVVDATVLAGGTQGPLELRVGSNKAVGIDASRNVTAGIASLATSATDGFLYIPTCAGTPTGAPTAITGFAPLVIDSTNNKLYAYIGGAWRAMN